MNLKINRVLTFITLIFEFVAAMSVYSINIYYGVWLTKTFKSNKWLFYYILGFIIGLTHTILFLIAPWIYIENKLSHCIYTVDKKGKRLWIALRYLLFVVNSAIYLWCSVQMLGYIMIDQHGRDIFLLVIGALFIIRALHYQIVSIYSNDLGYTGLYDFYFPCMEERLPLIF